MKPTKHFTAEELRVRYLQSSDGNYYVTDTIDVPHMYMIGAKHVVFASNRGGSLSEDCIRDGEKQGIRCEQRGCNLSFDGHESALLISCPKNAQLNGENAELVEYLQARKDLCESDGYACLVWR